MGRNRVLGLISLMLMLIVISGCGSKAAESSSSQLKPVATGAVAPSGPLTATLAIGGAKAMFALPVAVAQGLGYFEAEGLDVKVTDLKGGAQAAQAVVTGEMDFAYAALDHVIKHQSQGTDIFMLTVGTITPGVVIVVDARYKDEIKSIEDLKGRKVGVTSAGSGSHSALLKLMAINGVAESDVTILGVGVDTMPAALAEGKVVAAAGYDPAVTKAVRENGAYVLHSLRTLAETKSLYGSDYPFVGLVTHRDQMTKKPEVVKRMLAALLKAQEFIALNDAKSIAATVSADIKGLNEELYVAALANTKPTYSRDGEVTDLGVKAVLQTMKDNKAVAPDFQIPLAKVYGRP